MARAVRGEMNRLGGSRERRPLRRTVVGLDPSAPNGRPRTGGSDAAPAALPPIADEADDLKAIKQAVDDAAAVGGGLWLSYLFVLFYLAIAAGAVTHADLFLENPVKLPFLNVELPLLAFFFLAPILFLFVHAYALVHLVFLTDKAKRFDEALSKQIGDDSVAAADANDPRTAAIAGVRGQLPSNIFIQFLAGPRDRRAGSFGWLLRLISWSTLAIAPILLLLLIQLQFLPFHLSWIARTHRLALVADLVLIWWLWRKILSGRDPATPRSVPVWAWRALGVFLTVFVVLFSCVVATFPGEAENNLLAEWDTSGRAAWVRDRIFQSPVDKTTRRRLLPVSNTLVLTGFNIYEGLKIDDLDKLRGRDFVFLARGRDLNGAILDLASLPKVDFEGAQLQDASLEGARLQGASFDSAQLQGAWLSGAQLQGASLKDAQLQGAPLKDAQLQGASLDGVQLQGASLNSAWLQGASLDGAQLQGASLNWALLQGASLAGAQLQGASLDSAQLQGASLQSAALLQAVDLSHALLWRTDRAARPRRSVAEVAAVRLSDAYNTWLPFWKTILNDYPWDDKAYQNLRKKLMESLSPSAGDRALERVRTLDCANTDTTLTSCDPSLPLPPEAAAWRKSLVDACAADDAAYAKALAAELKTLVCSSGDDAPYVLRGLLRRSFEVSRLAAAGPEAPALVDFIMSKDCSVSGSLTNTDKANLLRLKQDAIKKP
jgi:uncharacterized protein YjbI with pentapeptide repeats